MDSRWPQGCTVSTPREGKRNKRKRSYLRTRKQTSQSTRSRSSGTPTGGQVQREGRGQRVAIASESILIGTEIRRIHEGKEGTIRIRKLKDKAQEHNLEKHQSWGKDWERDQSLTESTMCGGRSPSWQACTPICGAWICSGRHSPTWLSWVQDAVKNGKRRNWGGILKRYGTGTSMRKM